MMVYKAWVDARAGLTDAKGGKYAGRNGYIGLWMPSFWKRTGWRAQTNVTLKQIHTENILRGSGRVFLNFSASCSCSFCSLLVNFCESFENSFTTVQDSRQVRCKSSRVYCTHFNRNFILGLLRVVFVLVRAAFMSTSVSQFDFIHSWTGLTLQCRLLGIYCTLFQPK